MENFAVVVEELRQAGGLVEVHNAEEWKHALIRLLDDPEERAALGRRAEALVGRKAGALRRTADEIVSSL
jgi:3-deoxy-D-manno-octulosonic-acid transferase